MNAIATVLDYIAYNGGNQWPTSLIFIGLLKEFKLQLQ